MHPQRAAKLFETFLEEAVADYKFDSGSLSILGSNELVQHFEQLVNTNSHNGQFARLNQVQCDKCKDDVTYNLAPEMLRKLVFLESYEIFKWLIDGRAVSTHSRIMLQYGLLPCVSTFLQFNTRAEFLHIKAILTKLRFCNLNEKHLKKS